MGSAQEERELMDPLKVAADVVELLMENDRVRVIRGYLRPGEKAAIHSHPDHVVYVLKGGRVEMAYPTGKADTMELVQGKAIFMEAQSHEVMNIDDTDVELIIVELK